MILLEPEEFLGIMKDKGYRIARYRFGAGFALNILGVRDIQAALNSFEDTISVFYEDGENVWRTMHMQATTLPGTPHLLKPVNPDGCAVLVPGQYVDTYALGLHLGKYEALVQKRPVSVYRDNDYDAVVDKEDRTIETGMFGINIHRASLLAKVVGADSAGCQVIRFRDDYEKFIALCRTAMLRHGNGFTYTLVEL